MKCIMYVSKVSHFAGSSGVPSGFANIHQHARKTNLEKEISSIFSYRNGHYLQVIEGMDQRVDTLVEKINVDTRHRDITPIFEAPISERAFAQDSMRLIASLQKSSAFIGFMHQHAFKLSQISQQQKQRLEHFLDPSQGNMSHPLYKGQQVSLSAWPDFALFPLKPSLIDLCANLTSSAQSYDSLLEGRDLWSQLELNGALDRLNSFGILNVAKPIPTRARKPIVNAENTVIGFYQKMRRLLGATA